MLKIDRRMYIITRYIKHVGYGRGRSLRYENIDKRNCWRVTCCSIVNAMKMFSFVMQKCNKCKSVHICLHVD